MLKYWMAWVVFLYFGGCSPLPLLNVLSDSNGYRLTADIAYGALPKQKLDVYVPREKSGEPRPVVVFFIGGRWTENTRKDFFFVAEALTSSGCVVVVPDVRLYPAARFPTFVEDGARAVTWAHEHAAEFGGDRQRLFLMGYSSGAQIASMLTVNARYLAEAGGDRGWIRGFIGVAGPYDFLPPKPEEKDLQDIFGPPARYPEAEPVNFVDGRQPPMLLLQGRADVTVNPKNSQWLAEKVDEKGGRVRVIYYDKVDHYRIIGGMSRVLRGWAPTLEDVIAFIRERQ